MPLGSSSRSTGNAGVYIGTITSVAGDECYVTVPRLGGAYEYGPARFPAAYAGEDTRPGSAGGAYDGAPSHTHPLEPLAAGDEVAVAFLEGGRDELVVLVRLA